MSRGRPRLVDYHGTTGGYRNHGCRCDACKRAQMRWSKDYRLRSRADAKGNPTIRSTVDADPIRQHIHALVDSGYTLKAIARESGASFGAVQRIAVGARQRVHRRTAQLLLALEPLERVDVDEVVVDRLVAAYPNRIWDQIGATRAERVAAAEVLDARGHDVRRHLRDAGYGDQQIETPSRTGIETALSLRMGRDFALRTAS